MRFLARVYWHRLPVSCNQARNAAWQYCNACCHDMASLIKINEQAFVEKLVTHSPIEGFDVAVLHRLAGSDVVPLDMIIARPAQDCVHARNPRTSAR